MSSLGEELRDAGIACVRASSKRTNPWWWEDTLSLLYDDLLVEEYVDPDTVRMFAYEPHHPNVWGAFWREAIRLGWIEPVPEIVARSERAVAHASKMTVYRSLLYRGRKDVV